MVDHAEPVRKVVFGVRWNLELRRSGWASQTSNPVKNAMSISSLRYLATGYVRSAQPALPAEPKASRTHPWS